MKYRFIQKDIHGYVVLTLRGNHPMADQLLKKVNAAIAEVLHTDQETKEKE